ncbi:MAG: hypothetical protein BWY27_01117 [Bacteroidetes bacterium ADurb.Bin234]|nr:MAG: hypothetical protein BWY27_01117 [Bacteroidetes bacterium ADurb.Bin234]
MSFRDNKINISLKPAVKKINSPRPHDFILGNKGRKNDGKPVETGTIGAEGRKNATKSNSEAEAYLAYLNNIKLSMIKAGRHQDEIDEIDAKIAQTEEVITIDTPHNEEAPEEQKILGKPKNNAYIVIAGAIILLIIVFVKLAKK